MKMCMIAPYDGSVNSNRAHPPPPPPRAFFFFFFNKNVANAPWWGQHIYTNPHVGASGRGQIPHLWDKIKILFNDCSKKYSYSSSFQWFFSWFLKHYFVFNYNCNARQNQCFKTWGCNGDNFCFIVISFTTYTVPKFGISQSEALFTVLISYDIKSLT